MGEVPCSRLFLPSQFCSIFPNIQKSIRKVKKLLYNQKVKKIVVTGGHLTPALATIEELRKDPEPIDGGIDHAVLGVMPRGCDQFGLWFQF